MSQVVLSVLAMMTPVPGVVEKPVCSPVCKRRVINKQRRETVRPFRGWLRQLRWCESTNNYRAVGAGGLYTGAYQFDDRTWQSVGGSGRAMHAGKLEQDWRTVRLRKARGTDPWPVCG